jgi:hypothetical protein
MPGYHIDVHAVIVGVVVVKKPFGYHALSGRFPRKDDATRADHSYVISKGHMATSIFSASILCSRDLTSSKAEIALWADQPHPPESSFRLRWYCLMPMSLLN